MEFGSFYLLTYDILYFIQWYYGVIVAQDFKIYISCLWKLKIFNLYNFEMLSLEVNVKSPVVQWTLSQQLSHGFKQTFRLDSILFF